GLLAGGDGFHRGGWPGDCVAAGEDIPHAGAGTAFVSDDGAPGTGLHRRFREGAEIGLLSDGSDYRPDFDAIVTVGNGDGAAASGSVRTAQLGLEALQVLHPPLLAADLDGHRQKM